MFVIYIWMCNNVSPLFFDQASFPATAQSAPRHALFSHTQPTQRFYHHSKWPGFSSYRTFFILIKNIVKIKRYSLIAMVTFELEIFSYHGRLWLSSYIKMYSNIGIYFSK